MSLYNPAILTLVNGNPFNGAQVEAAFDDLSTAINGAVDSTSNVVDNNILPYNAFHQGAVTETWAASSDGQGPEVFLVVLEDTAAPATPWGPEQNSYDVPDTGVDFYLREAGTVRFDGLCELLKAKDTWNRNQLLYPGAWQFAGTPAHLGYHFTIQLYVDGTKRRENVWSYVPNQNTPSSFEKRGFPMNVSWSLAGMAAGKHTAFLKLTTVPNWDLASWKIAVSPTANQLPIVSQWVCMGRGLSVHAIYR
tara:strand:- start:6139 stop:6888 length:750 start_codon:yes stop_codon:yes gene_type:complete